MNAAKISPAGNRNLPLCTLACLLPGSALYLTQNCDVSSPSRSAVSTLSGVNLPHVQWSSSRYKCSSYQEDRSPRGKPDLDLLTFNLDFTNICCLLDSQTIAT